MYAAQYRIYFEWLLPILNANEVALKKDKNKNSRKMIQ